MKTIKILTLMLVLGLLMSCTFSVNVPKVRTGVTQTLEINENAASSPVMLKIEMGAGKLNLMGGASSLVEGTVLYNVDAWVPEIENDAAGITLSQTNTSTVGLPDGQIINEWDLKLGSAPINLSIASGAYEGSLDLSGIALTRLSIADGASKSTVTFNTPNPVEMEMLEYRTGASEVNLIGLGNATVDDVVFTGGAGSYELDFSGESGNDINVRISAGMSDIKLIIPANMQATITVNGGLSNINASGTWTINGNTYSSGSTGPTIRITVDMAVGNLNLIKE
jgi:hypothetical protein